MKAIYCAGELGRVVVDILERSSENTETVFLDDNSNLWGERIQNTEVLGGERQLAELNTQQTEVIVAFADDQEVRISLAEQVLDAGFSLFSAVDPDATVAKSATIGDGVIINAQSYIGPDVTVEDLVVVDSTVNISHDVYLSEGATIGPNATIAGGVTVGRDAFVGAGATVLDDVAIGECAVVGAGAVVTSSVASGTTVIGVPAGPR